MPERQIYAAYDDTGIYVYQAFNPVIAQAALENGTFGGGGFKLDRMTWIKPSFGWMLYRAGYALKENQERILKIKLGRAGFQQALAWAIETSWNPRVYTTETEWKEQLSQAPVRVQWDPDRNLKGGKLERRAIQIGLRGKAVYAYVNEWIIGLEDVTELAHQIGEQVRNRHSIQLSVPEERIYPVNDELTHRLGISG